MYVDETGSDDQPTGQGMTVDPDKIQALVSGFEAELADLKAWRQDALGKLQDVPNLGEDPCSMSLARVLSMNGQAAGDAARAYIDQLQTVVDQLRESSADYGLLEERNEGEFRRRSG